LNSNLIFNSVLQIIEVWTSYKIWIWYYWSITY
jgi:hypothetical protein